jgi:peptidoglycan/xylan/chitin deacetylase (PgdA/CDA1 family)
MNQGRASATKRVVRGMFDAGIALAAPAFWRRRRDSLVVLMYHRVLPAGHAELRTEQPGMVVSPASLELHIRVLKRHFSLIHLDEWLERVAGDRPLPERACAITFDDGWRDNFDHAFPVLEREQAPSTIYLVADAVGTSYAFWPNRLARWLRQDAPTADAPGWLSATYPAIARRTIVDIDEAIEACKKRYSDHELTELTAELQVAERPRDLMSWEEIAHMQSSGIVRFGSHTRRHLRLDRVESPEALNSEIAGSKRALEERLGAAPRTFCYPNGNTSAAAVSLVRDNYLGAVTTRPGWNTRSSDRATLDRIGVHEGVSNSADAFVARLADWF